MLLSLCFTLFNGMPVIIETTSAICSSLTISLLFSHSFSQDFCADSKLFSNNFSSSRSLAASSYFCFFTAVFLVNLISSSSFSKSVICLGTIILFKWTLDPASSNASIALSGRNLSVIYLLVSLTQAEIASSVYSTLWCSSYLILILFKISTVSSSLVGSIIIFWNLLSKAPSFSIEVLYSSNVVAPIHCTSPLARAGLNIFDASKLPVAPPAPTIVWISSINRIISLFFSNSFITAFILSSNWPLYLVPATKLAKSSEIIRLLNKTLDTFFWVILNAKPSAIADLPTPGSPIKRGLFFFLLLSICETLCISSFLPTIGSKTPFSAIKVKSFPKLSKTGVFVFFTDLTFIFSAGLSFPIFSSNESSSLNVLEVVPSE